MELLRIKEIQKERGLTNVVLAEKVNVTPATISNINKGTNFPKPNLLSRIAKELDVDIRELFYATKDSSLNGFVEYKNEVYKIKNSEDLEKLMEKVNKSV